MDLLNSMLDSQENFEMINPRGPLVVNTAYSSSSSRPPSNISDNTSASYAIPPSFERVNFGPSSTEDQQQQFQNQHENQSNFQYDTYM